MVTGSSGSLGMQLVAALQAQGHTVVPFDVVHSLDILNVAQLRSRLVDCRVTHVVHLAAMADLNIMRRLGDEAWHLNVQGTANVANVCHACHVPLYFASTCCIYGNHDAKGACHEESAVAPTEIYAQSKLAGEQVVQATLPPGQFVCMRLATFYGEGCREALAPNLFMQQILGGAPLTIHGTGTQTRTYTHVADVVTGIVAILEHTNGRERPIVNISTTRSVSVLELAKACMQAAGRQVPLIFGEDRPGQIYEEEIDASVLEALGWRANIDLEDGLRRLHKHMSAGDDKQPVAEAYK